MSTEFIIGYRDGERNEKPKQSSPIDSRDIALLARATTPAKVALYMGHILRHLDFGPELKSAREVTRLGLARLAGQESQQPSIEKMANALDPLAGSPAAQRRERIVKVMSYRPFLRKVKAPPPDASMAEHAYYAAARMIPLPLSDDEQVERRVKHYNDHLAKIDPRLRLDDAKATRLILRYGNLSDRSLAAHWAWRAGFETKDGLPKEGKPTAPFLRRYERDPVKKQTARKRKRK